MDLFDELKSLLSEREIGLILRVFPPDMFSPHDPERRKDHRFLKLDLEPYTTLYVFRDVEEQIKVYSSADMALITKATLLAYISSDASLAELKHTLERDSYPDINLPEESFHFAGEDLTAAILAMETVDDDGYNVITTILGDTLQLTHNRKTVNFAFVSQPTNGVTYFNSNPGLHHTLNLKDAPRLVINFNTLFVYQNLPDQAGYITVPFVDKEVFRYLHKVLIDLDKPTTFNLHSANDYYCFLKYLFYSKEQINERIKIVHFEQNRSTVEFVIGFLQEYPSMKKRSVGAHINEKFLEAFDYDDKSKSYREKELNLSDHIKNKWINLSTELDGDVLRVQGIHSVSFYKSFIERFFGEQAIERVGESV